MLENRKMKTQDFYVCRETHFIKKIFKIIIGIWTFWGICAICPDPLFMFIPIFRSHSCQMAQIERYHDIKDKHSYNPDSGHPVLKWQLVVNQGVFLAVNWLEMIYLYGNYY